MKLPSRVLSTFNYSCLLPDNDLGPPSVLDYPTVGKTRQGPKDWGRLVPKSFRP